MSDRSPTDLTRPLLGGAALALGGGAAVAWTVAGDAAVAGVLGRSAAVLGAVWLAYPGLRSMTPATWALVGVGLLVALLRPRAAWLVIPVILVVGISLSRRARPRSAGRPDRDRPG